jgi:hypothetical protein
MQIPWKRDQGKGFEPGNIGMLRSAGTSMPV